MECHGPTRNWRKRAKKWSDTEVVHYLNWSWVRYADSGKGPPYDIHHHDWTGLRALTLREARKRGLDISVTGL